MKQLLMIAPFLLMSGLGTDIADAADSPATYTYNCKTDAEIPQAQRDAINKVAMDFVTASQSSHPETAFAMLTSAVQETTSADKLAAEFASHIDQSDPYKNLKVDHSYLISTTGGGSEVRAICSSVHGRDSVSVQIKTGLTQAHVLISGQTRNNSSAFTLWLLPEGNLWRVQVFHVGDSAMVGRSAGDLLELARKQRDAGHAFNATMLYIGAASLSDWGPVFQPDIAQTIDEESKGLVLPIEFQQTPPMTWKMNGIEFKVDKVEILGVDGKIGLAFDLPLAAWTGDEDADKRNHAFLDAFIASHPDYSSAFGFLVAKAQKPDGSGGFASVYEVCKGYD